MIPLLPVQAKLFAFILSYQAEHNGMSPSFAEMSKAIGVSSKSGIHRLVNGLQGRGHIRYSPNKARSIVVIEPKLEVYRKALEEIGMVVRSATWVSEEDKRISQIVAQALHG